MTRLGRGPVLLPHPVGRPRRVRRAVPEEPLADPARAARRPGGYTAVELWTPRFHGDGRADWDVLVSITYRDWAAIEEHSDAEIAGAPVPGPGDVQARGAAPVRAARGALGRAAESRTARTAEAPRRDQSHEGAAFRRQCDARVARRSTAARAADHRADPDRARAPRPAREAGRLHDRHPARGVRDADPPPVPRGPRHGDDERRLDAGATRR